MRRGRQRGDPPAPPRGGQVFRRGKAQERDRNPGALRAQRQTLGCGEVERTGGAPHLSDHTAERRAFQAFLHRPEHIARIPGTDENQPVRVRAEALEPAAMRPASFKRREPVLDPQKRFSGRQLGQRETDRAGIPAAGEHLGQLRPPGRKVRPFRPLTRLGPFRRLQRVAGAQEGRDETQVREFRAHILHEFVPHLFSS